MNHLRANNFGTGLPDVLLGVDRPWFVRRGFALLFFVSALAAMPPTAITSISDEKDIKKAKGLEPARFWTAIANDQKLQVWQRALAVYFLFERHISQEATLAQLTGTLGKSIWIREDEISRVFSVQGLMPLNFTPGDSMFCIVAFRSDDLEKSNKDTIAIYINVSGELDAKVFRSIVISGDPGKYKDIKLKAWAIAPSWNEYLMKNTEK